MKPFKLKLVVKKESLNELDDLVQGGSISDMSDVLCLLEYILSDANCEEYPAGEYQEVFLSFSLGKNKSIPSLQPEIILD